MPAATIIHRLRDVALSMCGLESIDHASSDFTQRVLDDANRAVHECSLFIDDRFHYEARRGVYVQPSTTFTATFTQGSFAITSASPSLATWMAGCTAQVEGSSVFNRLEKSGGSWLLTRPYLGTSGSKTVTVWHDSVQLPPDVVSVKDPLFYNDKPLSLSDVETILKNIGEPTNRAGTPELAATVSTKVGDAAAVLALLLDALPPGNAEIVYTAAGFAALFADLDDTRTQIMPFDLEASIMIPTFQFHFSTFPLSNVTQQALATSYQIANDARERHPNRSGPSTLKRPKR